MGTRLSFVVLLSLICGLGCVPVHFYLAPSLNTVGMQSEYRTVRIAEIPDRIISLSLDAQSKRTAGIADVRHLFMEKLPAKLPLLSYLLESDGKSTPFFPAPAASTLSNGRTVSLLVPNQSKAAGQHPDYILVFQSIHTASQVSYRSAGTPYITLKISARVMLWDTQDNAVALLRDVSVSSSHPTGFVDESLWDECLQKCAQAIVDGTPFSKLSLPATSR